MSAHWEEKQFTVQEGSQPSLYFDYYGFPLEMYKLTWPAPGAPALAGRVRSLLGEAGFKTGSDGGKRGYDHGVFVPMKLVVPNGDIPTMQLSLHASLDPEMHLRAGAALAPLREEGVLIVASGFATHNLGEFRSGSPGAAPLKWVKDFDGWLVDTVTRAAPEERVRRLMDPEESAPNGSYRKAHPREEHFIQLHVAVGAAAPEAVAAVVAGNASAAAAVAADGTATAVKGTPAAAHTHRSQQIYSQYIMGVASMACFLME